MTAEGLTIVLAEDDDGHAALIRRSLERSRLQARILHLRTCRELLDYFARPDRPPSMLVLLNVRLSGGDGIEVLQHLKSRPETQSIPLYVLTPDDSQRQIDLCFALGCNAYVPIPTDYSEFMASMQRLCQLLEVSRFPGKA